jgi:hypothetical protein
MSLAKRCGRKGTQSSQRTPCADAVPAATMMAGGGWSTTPPWVGCARRGAQRDVRARKARARGRQRARRPPPAGTHESLAAMCALQSQHMAGSDMSARTTGGGGRAAQRAFGRALRSPSSSRAGAPTGPRRPHSRAPGPASSRPGSPPTPRRSSESSAARAAPASSPRPRAGGAFRPLPGLSRSRRPRTSRRRRTALERRLVVGVCRGAMQLLEVHGLDAQVLAGPLEPAAQILVRELLDAEGARRRNFVATVSCSSRSRSSRAINRSERPSP